MQRMRAFALVLVLLSSPAWAPTPSWGGAPAGMCPGFVENRGQLSEDVLYYFSAPEVTLYFTREAVVFDLREDTVLPGEATPETRGEAERAPRRGCAVWMRFAGAAPGAIITARDKTATRTNYFPGNDGSRWQTDVPAFREVTYHEIWPGIDVTYRADRGHLTYEISLAEQADPNDVRLVYEGAEAVLPGEDGLRSVVTPAGSFSELRATPGQSAGAFYLRGAFDEDIEDGPAGRLDPLELDWGTFLGGDSGEACEGLALDAAGNPVVVGYTSSTDFPATVGAYSETCGSGVNVFVSKLSATGDELLWSTFVGSGGWHEADAVTLDPSGNPVVTGRAASFGTFPTTPGAYDESHNGGDYDGFVFKLSADGSDLIWSTFLGGGGDWDSGYGIELDASGNPVVAGTTDSPDFPTTPGAYDESHNGDDDVFVCRLSPDGSDLQWSTLLGGAPHDWLDGMALDTAGSILLTGFSGMVDLVTPDFPTTPGAFNELRNDYTDAFVSLMDASGEHLLWSSFLGGNASSRGRAAAFSPSGNAVVTGMTWASDFPTTPGAYDETHNGGSDMFVTEFNATGSDLVWSTFLEGDLKGAALEYDSCGNLVVAGVGAYVARLDCSGSTLQWCTAVGPGNCTTLALDTGGNPVIAGNTSSPDFPTTPGAYDTTHDNQTDVFITKLDASGCASAVEGYIVATEEGDDRIVLRWSVASLHGISGFNVYRALNPDGPYQRVNEQTLDPVSPGVLEDNGAWPGTTFWYELRATFHDGHEEEVGTGPVCATTSGALLAAIHPPNPNPFSTQTSVVFDVPGHVCTASLDVYNVRGQLVKRLTGLDTGVGRHSATWDGTDAGGGRTSSGVYFLRLSVGDEVRTEKLMLIR